jgi:hypothetical protein
MSTGCIVKLGRISDKSGLGALKVRRNGICVPRPSLCQVRAILEFSAASGNDAQIPTLSRRH